MRFRSWLQQLVPEINASNRNLNNLENLQKQKGGKLPAEGPLHAKLFFARAVQAGSYEQITIIHRLTTINVSGKRHRKVDSKCAALRSLGTAPLDAMWASTTSTRAEQAWATQHQLRFHPDLWRLKGRGQPSARFWYPNLLRIDPDFLAAPKSWQMLARFWPPTPI